MIFDTFNNFKKLQYFSLNKNLASKVLRIKIKNSYLFLHEFLKSEVINVKTIYAFLGERFGVI